MRYTVFEWEEGSDPEVCFEQALGFLRRQEKGYRERLIDPFVLKRVVEAALVEPEGDYNSFSGGGVGRRYRWRATTSLLGCAWVGIGKARFLALSYERPTVSGYDLPVYALRHAANQAGRFLEDHLREKEVLVPERVERVGNILFGGFSFQVRPKWVAPAEYPELRVQVDLYKLVWEDLRSPRALKPETLSRHVVEALREKGIEARPSAVVKALKGKASLMGVLGSSLLGGL